MFGWSNPNQEGRQGGGLKCTKEVPRDIDVGAG